MIGAVKGHDFGANISKPSVTPGRETIPQFWYPQRAGVRFADSRFRERLHEFDPALEVVWNPIIERWQVWTKQPRIQNSFCPGWMLLFIHNGPSGEHLPLDERVFARLYACSARQHGSMKGYFDRIASEMERDREQHEKWARADAVDRAMPLWDHSRIRVGYGAANGSKFSQYHS